MEQALDQCIALIYRLHNGRSLIPVNVVTIEKKVEALRAFANLPTVAPYKSLIDDITRIVTDEKAARNHIVHGMPIKVEKNGTAHIVLVRPNFDSPEHLLRVVDRKEWKRLREACWEVQTYAMILTFGLTPEDVKRNEIENAGRREWFVRGADTLNASKKVRNLYKDLWPDRTED